MKRGFPLWNSHSFSSMCSTVQSILSEKGRHGCSRLCLLAVGWIYQLHKNRLKTQVFKLKDNWETFSLSGKEFVVFSNVILRNRQAGHGLLRCCGTEAMPGSPKPRRLEGEGSVGCFLETDSLLTETLTGPARCTQLKMHC